ncbi:hypothetical protein BpHYR1_045394 [Brachionus plicatilis]|uniref:Uncharacterized protein n=1 Tax=Brachionus plicatilis TaxID=10195 RepID=A0A3M7SLS9_BRAPC|nr:hypothetical protein BpHYR1_045394 [Brachionus plicatilis]
MFLLAQMRPECGNHWIYNSEQFVSLDRSSWQSSWLMVNSMCILDDAFIWFCVLVLLKLGSGMQPFESRMYPSMQKISRHPATGCSDEVPSGSKFIKMDKDCSLPKKRCFELIMANFVKARL